MFIVVKQMLTGVLAGLTIDDVTPVRFEPGVYRSCAGNSTYRVLSCTEVAA